MSQHLDSLKIGDSIQVCDAMSEGEGIRIAHHLYIRDCMWVCASACLSNLILQVFLVALGLGFILQGLQELQMQDSSELNWCSWWLTVLQKV